MKAKKCTNSIQVEKKPVLVASEAKENVCAFFKLLLEIDKRNNPALYENQESRNCSHSPFEGLIAFANVTLEEGLYLGSIGIHRKLDGGFRITFPTRKVGETNLCIYHPINPMVSKEFEMAICSRAEEVFGEYSTA